MMLGGMNAGHAKMADWGLSYLPDIRQQRIADLGCGGGRNAGELLRRYPESRLVALDYSELSVEKTRAYNEKMIRAGRCEAVQGDVHHLELPDDTFDLVTAFETVYFWGELAECFAEVCRILKEGGLFLICNESDGTDEAGLKYEKIIEGMKCYTEQQLKQALRAAGFSSVEVHRRSGKPWITVLGRK